MSIFTDSSALVKLYADEEDHELVRLQSIFVISQLARVEVPAALWRKQRMGELTTVEAGLLVADFEDDYFGTEQKSSRFAIVAVTATVIEGAARLAGSHGLRAYDSVQLASACAMRATDPACNTISAFDKALRTSAIIEGFSLL
ncbi:MAG: type II toxin-antitoxin system VapC family toxin [Candidatus Dormibacteraceae bacterium]